MVLGRLFKRPVERNTTRLFLIGIGFVLISSLASVSLLRMVGDAIRVRTWTPVPARILSIQLLGCAPDQQGAHWLVCSYEYQIGGRTCRGTRVGLSDHSDSIGSWQQNTYRFLKDAFDKGLTVTCYVNPNNSYQSIIMRNLRPDLFLFELLFVVGFNGIGVGMCVYAWRAKGPTVPESAVVRPHMRTLPHWLNIRWFWWRRRPEWMPVAMLDRLLWLRRLGIAIWILWPGAIVIMMFVPWLSAGFLFGSLALVITLFVGHRFFLRYYIRRFERKVRLADYALCLQCGYPLHGLPPSHHCPECGAAYELKAVRRVWGEVLDDEVVDELAKGNWECLRCGQKVPGHFEVCWNCQTPRLDPDTHRDLDDPEM